MVFILLACLILLIDRAVARFVRRAGRILRILVLASVLAALYVLTR